MRPSSSRRLAKATSPTPRRSHCSITPPRNRRAPWSGSAASAWVRVRVPDLPRAQFQRPLGATRRPRRHPPVARRGRVEQHGRRRAMFRILGEHPADQSASAGGSRSSPASAWKLPCSSLRRTTAALSTVERRTAEGEHKLPRRRAYTSSAIRPFPAAAWSGIAEYGGSNKAYCRLAVGGRPELPYRAGLADHYGRGHPAAFTMCELPGVQRVKCCRHGPDHLFHKLGVRPWPRQRRRERRARRRGADDELGRAAIRR